MTDKNIFKRRNLKSDRVLLCPKCYETLFTSDIEHFEKCPYCDIKINMDNEVEDYILKPVIDRWIHLQNDADSFYDDHYASNDFQA